MLGIHSQCDYKMHVTSSQSTNIMKWILHTHARSIRPSENFHGTNGNPSDEI